MNKITLRLSQLFCGLCLTLAQTSFAQNYTWMKGSTAYDQPGIYGTKGVSNPANTPGARNGAMSWKDAAGDFWLFGGYGVDVQGNFDFLNDLWKYTHSTNVWTWIGGDSLVDVDGVYGTQGVPAASNWPGSRAGSVIWKDASGNIWLFGGEGLDAFSTPAELNDLWKFNPATNQWTWMSGSNTAMQTATYGSMGVPAATNEPGAAYSSVGWTDASGNLWLFGGSGFDAVNYGLLNDLWKYNITTNQWTWMKGTGLVDVSGSYGTLSVPAAGNTPGARAASGYWADAGGDLWLFGGYGFDASGVDDFLNDQWKYSISTNQWTWMKGSNAVAQGGTYGTQGTSNPLNIPGARIGQTSWTDASGNFYMYGGVGYFTASNMDDMGELWKYSPGVNEWTWITGNDAGPAVGVYGTQTVPSATNHPGSKSFTANWIDNSGNLWIFGGIGNSFIPSGYGVTNDLWKFSGCSAPTLTISSSSQTLCSGQTATLTVSGTATTYTWSTAQTGTSTSISPIVTNTYYVLGTNASNCTGGATFTQVVAQGGTVTASSSKSVACKGDKIVFTASGASSYSWSTSPAQVTSTIAVTPTTTTTYTVIGIEPNGCKSSFAITQSVTACTGISQETKPESFVKLYPNPSNGMFTLNVPSYTNTTQFIVFNAIGQKVLEQAVNAETMQIQSTLQRGVYFYQLINGTERTASGKLIIE